MWDPSRWGISLIESDASAELTSVVYSLSPTTRERLIDRSHQLNRVAVELIRETLTDTKSSCRIQVRKSHPARVTSCTTRRPLFLGMDPAASVGRSRVNPAS